MLSLPKGVGGSGGDVAGIPQSGSGACSHLSSGPWPHWPIKCGTSGASDGKTSVRFDRKANACVTEATVGQVSHRGIGAMLLVSGHLDVHPKGSSPTWFLSL